MAPIRSSWCWLSIIIFAGNPPFSVIAREVQIASLETSLSSDCIRLITAKTRSSARKSIVFSDELKKQCNRPRQLRWTSADWNLLMRSTTWLMKSLDSNSKMAPISTVAIAQSAEITCSTTTWSFLWTWRARMKSSTELSNILSYRWRHKKETIWDVKLIDEHARTFLLPAAVIRMSQVVIMMLDWNKNFWKQKLPLQLSSADCWKCTLLLSRDIWLHFYQMNLIWKLIVCTPSLGYCYYQETFAWQQLYLLVARGSVCCQRGELRLPSSLRTNSYMSHLHSYGLQSSLRHEVAHLPNPAFFCAGSLGYWGSRLPTAHRKDQLFQAVGSLEDQKNQMPM